MTGRHTGTPWLTELDSDDIDILLSSFDAAQAKLHRVHPEEQEMWNELMDLQDDLHVTWSEVWVREHPTQRRA